MVLGKLGQCLQKNPHNRIILDYDIKGFFDNISHEWIIKHFPMHLGFESVLLGFEFVLKSWLSAGILLPSPLYGVEWSHGKLLNQIIYKYL